MTPTALSAEDNARPVQDTEIAPFLQIAVIQDAKMATPPPRGRLTSKPRLWDVTTQAKEAMP